MQSNNSSFGDSSDFGIENQLLNQQKSPLDLENFNSSSSSSFNPTSTFEFGGDIYALGEYEIQEGDTLGYLAQETLGDSSVFGVIASINGIKNPDEIFAGQEILLPMNVYTFEESNTQESMSVYTVGEGDTLANIAEKIVGDASVYQEIADYNNISNPNFIFEGQELLIPIDANPTQSYNDSDILIPSLKTGGNDDLGIVELAVQAQDDNINSIGDGEVVFTSTSEQEEQDEDNLRVASRAAKALGMGLNQDYSYKKGGQDYVTKLINGNFVEFEAKNGKPKLPVGVNAKQFADISETVRKGAKNFSDDIFVQGSRVSGTSYKTGLPMKPNADIDIGVGVTDRFDELLDTSFAGELGKTKGKEFLKAIRDDRIDNFHASIIPNTSREVTPELKPVAKKLKSQVKAIGTNIGDVDLSVIKREGNFDLKPQIQLATNLTKFSKPVAKVADFVGKAAKPIGLAIDAFTVSQAIYEDGGIGENTGRTGATMAGEWAGSAAGAWGGAQAGALLGTAIAPGVGTVIGGAIGGLVVGYIGADIGADAGSDLFDFSRKWW